MKKELVVAIVITIAIVVLAAVFASGWPDGLEFVAEKLGFISSAKEEPMVAAPLPDYTIPGIKSPFWSTAAAGFIGVAVVFLVAFILGKLIRKK